MLANELSDFLAERADDVCRLLLPCGKRNGAEWRAGDISGNPGDSLGVHLEGAKSGVWADFATGETGDLLDLWCMVRGINLNEAMDQIRSHYNLPAPDLQGGKERKAEPITPPKVQSPKSAAKAFLESRLISEAAAKAYRLGENGDELAFPYFHGDNVVGVKFRNTQDKSKQRWEKGSSAVLFGWQAVPDMAREVVITEGEIDALTMYDYGYTALSVPAGAGSMSWIEYEYDNLERFDRIYLFMDADEAGRKKIGDIVDRLGRHRVHVLDLGDDGPKDANELAQEGFGKEVVDRIVAKAHTLDPSELTSASNYTDAVVREFYPPDDMPRGVLPPFHVGDLRFRDSELILVNGVNGHGKSKLVQQFVLEAGRQNYRACIASLEMPPAKYLKHMVLQASGIQGTGNPSPQYIRKISDEWFGDWLWLFDLVGTAKQERLFEVMAYARARYGITVFAIDSLLKCGIGEDDYDGQKRFVERLADFKNKYGLTVFLVTHSRKGESEERPSGKMDVKGSGSITDLVDTGMTIWRNKKKEADVAANPDDEDAKEGPDAMLYLWKHRYGDHEGQKALWYYQNCYQFVGSGSEDPRRYVDYSALDTH